MGEAADTLLVLDQEFESALLAETGPNLSHVMGRLDSFAKQIDWPGNAAGAVEKLHDGAEPGEWPAVAQALFWVRAGHWVRARECLAPLAVGEPSLPEPLSGFIWLHFAESEYKLRQFRIARDYLLRARHVAERSGHAALKAHALAFEAQLALKQNQLDEAAGRIEEAGRFPAVDGTGSIPAALSLLAGRIQLARGRLAEAFQLVSRARSEAQSDRRACLAITRFLGGMELHAGIRAKAWGTFDAGLALARSEHDWLAEASFLTLQGDWFQEKKMYGEARKRYEAALSINDALEYAPGRARCLIGLAASALAHGGRKKCAEHHEAARRVLEATPIPPLESDAQLVWAKLGEAEKATDTIERYEKLRERLAGHPGGFRYAQGMFHYGCYMAKRRDSKSAAPLIGEAFEKATPLQANLIGRLRDVLSQLPGDEWACVWWGVFQKVQGRNADLEAARHQVEKMTHQRRGATTMLVHDLKNQMTSLLALLDMARQAKTPLLLGGVDRVPLLLAHARMLSSRLESLTEFYRAELTGTLEPKFAETDMNKLLESVREVGELVSVSEIEWSLTAAEALPPIVCDGQQVQRVFENLIFNARAYTLLARDPAQRYVRVEAAWDERRLEFRGVVTNGGPLIPPNKMEEIFECFVSLSYDNLEEVRESIFNKAHVGLGLHYCRQVMSAHGGRIWADNLKDGTGVRFTFTLPRRRPAAGAPVR
jgi:signal transduction histidine kinase